MIRTTLSFVK